MSEMTRRQFVKGAALAPLAIAPLKSMAQTASGAGDRWDVVVAGAGHNSLMCAAYLAKAGNRVLVLEGRPTIGGGCKTAEVCLPGFKEDLCSSVHGFLQSNPALKNNELQLRDYGLEYIDPDPIMHTSFEDGSSITVWKDVNRTYEEYARISKKDAETFRRLTAEYKAYMAATAAAAVPGSNTTSASQPPKIPQGGMWQRRFGMSGYDLVRELFSDDRVRRFHLAVGHFGAIPASDPATGNQAFTVIGQQLNGRPMPKGGSGMLSVALGRFLEAHNAVILTNKPVTEFLIEAGKCVGVRCADGSSYRAQKAVVSTIHVKHLVNMAPRELWGEDFLDGVELYQPEHAMFSFHYATKEPPKYRTASGTISTTEAAFLTSPERVLRLSYDNARGAVDLSDPPPIQVVCPSVGDPTRAPAGYHTLKIEGTLPYQLKEGPEHWDEIKEQVADGLLNYLRRFAPNLTNEVILAKFLESPLDIERMNPAMWRGSVHHGANYAAQAGPNRPVPGWAQYRMPIPGLYQTGACTAPGGSITGMPGRNAASAILKDFGTSIEAVVASNSKA